jgi:hypothetical protein
MKRLSLVIVLALLGAGCTVSKDGQIVSESKPAPLPQPAQVIPERPEEAAVETPAFEEAEPAAEVSTRDNDLERGMQLLAAGDLRKARMALSIALTKNLPEAEENDALAKLKDINAKIFLSTADAGDCETYEVISGDTLSTIAQRKGTTVEMIQRLNSLKGTKLMVGQRLKMLKGTFSVTVYRDRFIMDIKLDSAFIKRYRVGLGLDDSTPLGEFVIKNRIPEPADGSYPYGHEKHRLGHRWLGLKSEAGYKGYGIHGCRSDEENSIGTACSQGCVRMSKDDLDEFYDIIPTGTKVVIMERTAAPVVSK